jgi:hypothetical protein
MLKNLIAIAALVLPVLAHSAIVTSIFTPLGGARWSVEIGVNNDSSTTPVNQFTVYFSEALFANLQLDAGPPTWDTIVIQPDLGLPASGYVDGLAIDTGDALMVGKSIGGFRVTFDLLAGGSPLALAYETYDVAFDLLDSGTTLVMIVDPDPTTVPEASALWLSALGLSLLAWVRQMRAAARLHPE